MNGFGMKPEEKWRNHLHQFSIIFISICSFGGRKHPIDSQLLLVDNIYRDTHGYSTSLRILRLKFSFIFCFSSFVDLYEPKQITECFSGKIKWFMLFYLVVISYFISAANNNRKLPVNIFYVYNSIFLFFLVYCRNQFILYPKFDYPQYFSVQVENSSFVCTIYGEEQNFYIYSLLTAILKVSKPSSLRDKRNTLISSSWMPFFVVVLIVVFFFRE